MVNPWCDGFETGPDPVCFVPWSGTVMNGGAIIACDDTFAHCGIQSAISIFAGPGADAYAYIDFSEPLNTVYTSHEFLLGEPPLPDVRLELLEIVDAANTVITQVAIHWDPMGWPFIRVRLRPTMFVYEAPLPFPLFPEQWYCLETSLFRDPVDGALQVWIDGFLVLEVTDICTDFNEPYTTCRIGIIGDYTTWFGTAIWSDCFCYWDERIGCDFQPEPSTTSTSTSTTSTSTTSTSTTSTSTTSTSTSTTSTSTTSTSTTSTSTTSTSTSTTSTSTTSTSTTSTSTTSTSTTSTSTTSTSTTSTSTSTTYPPPICIEIMIPECPACDPDPC